MIQTSPPSLTQASEPPAENLTLPLLRLIFKFALGFAVVWLLFYLLYIQLPFVSSGADVVFHAKMNYEFSHPLFSGVGSDTRRIIIFGDSKILAGFLPLEFDRIAASNGTKTASFNSGYPGHADFVPQFNKLVNNGTIPDVVLLTAPWMAPPRPSTVFNFLGDDHATALRLFPFRSFPRDALSFYMSSRRHGGIHHFYAESANNVQVMLSDRGYYFISEQSHYPNNQLPEDFHLSSDLPDKPLYREADPSSPELTELNGILQKHNIACYYVPSYVRQGERAPLQRDTVFAKIVESHSNCIVLGPNYFIYPNSYFSDQTHLNPIGAEAYTKDIYALVSTALKGGR